MARTKRPRPTPTPSPTLARLLSAWMSAADGRTATAFAVEVGMDHSSLSRARAGIYVPSTQVVARICVALGASRDECIRLYRELGHELPPVLLPQLDLDAPQAGA